MYSMYIGKKYLEIYNSKNKHLSSKEFFDEVYFPLFFNNERYMQLINNSPFDQLCKHKEKKNTKPQERIKCLKKFHDDILESPKPHMGIAIGFPAGDITETTSGQVSNIEIKYLPDDIYCSWIGSGFGIGLQGGFVILIDHPKILELIAEGWKYYRKFLTDTPNLKPYQIYTWNGKWLSHVLSKKYKSTNPLENFFIEFETELDKKTNEIKSVIPTQSWINIIFSLSRQFHNETMMAYVFSLSQMNTTVGFIHLNLKEVKREIDMYDSLFGVFEGFEDVKQLDDFYDTEHSFVKACQMGSIGLRAIEPKHLREYFPGEKMPKLSKDIKTEINFKIYLSWIRAMLNSQELYNFANELSTGLHKFSSSFVRGKTTNKQLVVSVLESKSKKDFIQSLTRILEEDSSYGDLFDRVVKEILKMPNDNFPLFVTLLRFKYAMIQ